MVSWESASTGAETIPPGYPYGDYEIHITGDVAWATQQLWYMTKNTSWLRQVYPGLLKETANFWVSRVEWNGNVAHINRVIPPDEYKDKEPYTNDSVYTNWVAKVNLRFATEAANILGETPEPEWATVADAIPILFDEGRGIHPEYSGYMDEGIKQADAILLGYPLMMDMSSEVRKADLDYYLPK